MTKLLEKNEFISVIMLTTLATRIVSCAIGGGILGGCLGLGSLHNHHNISKFNKYKEFNKLPLYGAKLGSLVGGAVVGFYPIVIPYLVYKTGLKYDLTKEDVQKVTQNVDLNTL